MKRALITFTAFVFVLCTAGAAHADVLVNAPRKAACWGIPIKVGVFHQPGSGGSTWFRIKVRKRGGGVIFRQRGHAKSHWKYWKVQPRRPGHFIVKYRVAGGHVRYRVTRYQCE
jgi:hypothetical protein